MVQGRISDMTGRPLSGAIVYLKDVRTLDVKSYITEKDGEYRFEQLSSNDDYKLWAEMDEKKSQVRTISSFDPKNSFLINLHIHTEK
ncbi:MAG TPA: carboxypeptidase-like regulatory domain-containing protein [Acidobacteriaceae bacterium]|nr:carboxypeptidase-like regulatory domain-containing protein [Acidobacteriaceae bacterium]